MNSSQAAGIAVYLMVALIGLMGAWDGLARRHIRIRIGVYGSQAMISGPGAVLVGLICLLFLVPMAAIARSAIPDIVAGCTNPICAAQRLVTPPFTYWETGLVMVALGVIFVPWLLGAADFDGPLRTRLLAPGVWYRERELISRVRQRLGEQGKTVNDVDVMLELADSVLRTFHGVSPTMPNPRAAEETPPTRAMVVQWLTHSSLVHKRREATEAAQRIIVEVAALYAMEKLEAAEQRWPWRRRFLELFP